MSGAANTPDPLTRQQRQAVLSAMIAVLSEKAGLLSMTARRGLVEAMDKELGGSPAAPKHPILYNAEVTHLLTYMAESRGYTLQELRGEGQNRALALRRMEGYWVLSKQFGLSTKRIGQIFNRDHTTVVYGLKTLQERADDKRWVPPDLPDLMRASRDYALEHQAAPDTRHPKAIA